MSKKSDICQICLRTDRKMKIIDTRLTEFHDELCDFSIQTVDPLYCTECEHLLRKLYKFKTKCVMAFQIYQKWKKTKGVEKNPMHLLHKLLPATSLGLSSPSNFTSYSYIYEEDPGSLSSVNVLRINPRSNVNVLSHQPHHLSVPGEKIADNRQYCDNVSSEDFQEHSDPNNTIKLEIEDSDFKSLHLQDLFLKTEDTTQTFVEIPIINDGTFLNAEEMSDIKYKEESDVLDGYSSDSDKDKELKREEKSSDIPNNHCRIRVTAERRIRSFTDLDVKPLSHNINEKQSISKKKMKDSKIQRSGTKIGKDDKQRRVKKRLIDKDKKKERFCTKKDILALANLVDAGATEENSVEVSKGDKVQFSKERLIAELQVMFASCEELTTKDGILIDKQFILSCLDEKVTEFIMKQLWNAVYGKCTIKPKALKLFKCIQNKYKNEYESVFEIEYLNTKEKMLEEFQRRKTYQCYLTADYKCAICFQGFKHEKKLEYHNKCHDVSAGEFICSICSVRQKHMKSLISHLNSHEAVYKCKLCPLVTYYKCSMVNHYQLHKGVKFRCEPCDTTFGSQSAFRTHVSYRHPRAHVCTACGRAFLSEVGLKWHQTRAHQNQPPATKASAPVRCPQCPLSFPTQEACSRHVRISHEPVVKGRRLGSTIPYRPRMYKPRKKPVITCRLCAAVGSSIGWLNLHFRTEHPSMDLALMYRDKQKHLCHVCGKGFMEMSTLRAHLAVHSGLRPWRCAECGARFARALSLRAHRAAHAPPTWPCPHCGKKFRSQSNLTNHVRVHIGDRRYKCKICGKGFLHRGSMNEHVRGVHYNVRRVPKRGVTGGTEGVVRGGTEAEMICVTET